MHPSHRQSQHRPAGVVDGVGRNNPAAGAAVRSLAAQARVAYLQPGDALYIPPFWFHTVTAMTSSLSLSVVSPSEEEMVYSKAYYTPVPLGAAGSSPRAKAIVAHMMADALLQQLPGLTPAQFVQQLLTSRFAPLHAAAMSADDSASAGAIGGMYAVHACSLPRTFDCFATAPRDIAARTDVHERVGVDVRAAAQVVWNALQRPANDTAGAPPVLTPPVVELLLGDYVEGLATWAVGACNVALFLDRCFPVSR